MDDIYMIIETAMGQLELMERGLKPFQNLINSLVDELGRAHGKAELSALVAKLDKVEESFSHTKQAVSELEAQIEVEMQIAQETERLLAARLKLRLKAEQILEESQQAIVTYQTLEVTARGRHLKHAN